MFERAVKRAFEVLGLRVEWPGVLRPLLKWKTERLDGPNDIR